MAYFHRVFGGLVDAAKRSTNIRRPGAGPKLIAFSRAEVNALSRYAIGYPLETASDDECAAFNSGLNKIKARATIALLLLCVASSAHAQTWTSADIGKHLHHAPATADDYALLKRHEFHAPMELPPGPIVASTGSSTANGPWDWPPERPARRLDGTLVDSPPTIYGELPWFVGVRSRSYPPRTMRPERKR